MVRVFYKKQNRPQTFNVYLYLTPFISKDPI